MDDPLAGYRRGDGEPTATVDQVVDQVIDDPTMVSDLAAGLESERSEMQRRAAAVLAQVAKLQPHLLVEHKSVVLGVAGETTDLNLQEHLASVVPLLPLADGELEEVTSILHGYLNSDNMVVTVEAIDALGHLARKYPACRDRVQESLEVASKSSRSYVSKRAQRALTELPE